MIKKIIEIPVKTEAVEVVVLGHIVMESTLSTRKWSNVSDVRQTNVPRLLKHHKFYSLQN